MKQTEKKRLIKNWDYAKDLWHRKKKEHNLKGWSLYLSSATKTAGRCDYNRKRISISSVLLRGHNCDKAKVKKVLMHEIAHALKPGHGHNKVWKDKCRKIGGDTRLAVTMVLPGMNWAMTCPRCKWRNEYLSKPSYKNMVCSECYTPVRVSYIK